MRSFQFDRIEFIELLAQYALIESNPSEIVDHLMRILLLVVFQQKINVEQDLENSSAKQTKRQT